MTTLVGSASTPSDQVARGNNEQKQRQHCCHHGPGPAERIMAARNPTIAGPGGLQGKIWGLKGEVESLPRPVSHRQGNDRRNSTEAVKIVSVHGSLDHHPPLWRFRRSTQERHEIIKNLMVIATKSVPKTLLRKMWDEPSQKPDYLRHPQLPRQMQLTEEGTLTLDQARETLHAMPESSHKAIKWKFTTKMMRTILLMFLNTQQRELCLLRCW